MRNVETYKDFEIFQSFEKGSFPEFMILDERGSGHVEASLEDCKATIDSWEE